MLAEGYKKKLLSKGVTYARVPVHTMYMDLDCGPKSAPEIFSGSLEFHPYTLIFWVSLNPAESPALLQEPHVM